MISHNLDKYELVLYIDIFLIVISLLVLCFIALSLYRFAKSSDKTYDNIDRELKNYLSRQIHYQNMKKK